jgi:transcriptional regulator with XRE-family HTH domain
MRDTSFTYPPSPELAEPAAFPARLEALIGDMSVRAFARRAGVSDTFLRQCLAGRTEPTRTKLLAIAEAGGTTVEWLATGNPPPQGGVPIADPGAAPCNRELLTSILEVTDEVLAESHTRLEPSRKARLVSALYDMHVGSPPLGHLPRQHPATHLQHGLIRAPATADRSTDHAAYPGRRCGHRGASITYGIAI